LKPKYKLKSIDVANKLMLSYNQPLLIIWLSLFIKEL